MDWFGWVNLAGSCGLSLCLARWVGGFSWGVVAVCVLVSAAAFLLAMGARLR